MDAVPRGRIFGSGKKLTAFLQDQLALGKNRSKILAALEERGLTASKAVREPPELRQEDRLYWTAFVDLVTCRQIQAGPIPWTAIERYATRYDLPLDELKHIVWLLDGELREHYAKEHEND